MALRKYKDDVEIAETAEAAPSVAETAAAVTATPDEQSETKPSQAQEAAGAAIRERLAEAERATRITPPNPQQAPQPAIEERPQQPTAEDIISKSGLPERAQCWLREHSDYVTDPVKNQTLIALHSVAVRQSGAEWTDGYFARMDELLGHKQAPRPQPRPQANNNQRVQQQAHRGAPLSAPPSREVMSMSSGRPLSYRSPLTKDEQEIALACRLPGQSAEAALQQYQHSKEQLTRDNRIGERAHNR
jgi:hypothetical protein